MAILQTSLNITRTEFLPPHQYSVITPSMQKRSYHHRRFIITFSNRPRSEIVGNDQKRKFLERYGLNPDDYLPKPSQKIKKRRGQGDSEMRNNAPVQEPKPPQETHKLLQVLGGNSSEEKAALTKKYGRVAYDGSRKRSSFFDFSAGGSPQSLKPGHWLDLYSGTGSVGIEAISRGCSQAHFVEMDPWVVTDVLQPNLESTGFLEASVIHTARVETFLENAERYLGKDAAFDYISVTPPYMLVDYAVLMNQISNSSVVGENTFIVLEYPLRTEMLDSCGCSVKIADRRFGRTHLAIYGPVWAQRKVNRRQFRGCTGVPFFKLVVDCCFI